MKNWRDQVDGAVRRKNLKEAVIAILLTLLVLGLTFFGAWCMTGCAVDQSWKPVIGENFARVHAKLSPGVKFITIEGCEVRYWLEHPRTAQHWLYYAKFDGPPRKTYFIKYDDAGNPTLDRVEYSPSKLVEWGRNRSAYREANP